MRLYAVILSDCSLSVIPRQGGDVVYLVKKHTWYATKQFYGAYLLNPKILSELYIHPDLQLTEGLAQNGVRHHTGDCIMSRNNFPSRLVSLWYNCCEEAQRPW